MTILNELINYAEDCISGKIVSCKKTQMGVSKIS